MENIFFQSGPCDPDTTRCVYETFLFTDRHSTIQLTVFKALFRSSTNQKMYMCPVHGRLHVCTMSRENCRLRESTHDRDLFRCVFTGQMCSGDNPETISIIHERKFSERRAPIREIDWMQEMTREMSSWTADHNNINFTTVGKQNNKNVDCIGRATLYDNNLESGGTCDESTTVSHGISSRSGMEYEGSPQAKIEYNKSPTFPSFCTNIADKRAFKLKEEIRNKVRARSNIVQMGHDRIWLETMQQQIHDLGDEQLYAAVLDKSSLVSEFVKKTAESMLTEFRNATNDLILRRNVTGEDALQISSSYGKMAIDYLFYHLTTLSVEQDKVIFESKSTRHQWTKKKHRSKMKKMKKLHDTRLNKAKELIKYHNKHKRHRLAIACTTVSHQNRLDVFKTSISKIATAYYGKYLERLKKYRHETVEK